VDDLDATLAELSTEGIEVLFRKKFSEFSIDFAYLNTDKVGGVMIELIEYMNR